MASRPRATRTCARLVRLTPDELRTIADRARECGKPVGRYLRETALGAVPRVRRTHASDLLVRQLADLATRLGALARVATNTGLPAAAEFESAVGDVLETIRQID